MTPIKTSILFALSALACVGCTSSPKVTSDTGQTTEVTALREEIETLKAENKLLSLKLQDEIERSTIQNFLRMREVAVAKQEAAALRDRCGDACADID